MNKGKLKLIYFFIFFNMNFFSKLEKIEKVLEKINNFKTNKYRFLAFSRFLFDEIIRVQRKTLTEAKYDSNEKYKFYNILNNISIECLIEFGGKSIVDEFVDESVSNDVDSFYKKINLFNSFKRFFIKEENLVKNLAERSFGLNSFKGIDIKEFGKKIVRLVLKEVFNRKVLKNIRNYTETEKKVKTRQFLLRGLYITTDNIIFDLLIKNNSNTQDEKDKKFPTNNFAKLIFNIAVSIIDLKK